MRVSSNGGVGAAVPKGPPRRFGRLLSLALLQAHLVSCRCCLLPRRLDSLFLIGEFFSASTALTAWSETLHSKSYIPTAELQLLAHALCSLLSRATSGLPCRLGNGIIQPRGYAGQISIAPFRGPSLVGQGESLSYTKEKYSKPMMDSPNSILL